LSAPPRPSTLKISPRIEWAAPYSLERTGGKTKFFERRY
jgi:hypothetical protein